MPNTAAQIFRDNEVPGVPSSGKHKPKKSEIRSWGSWLESFLPGIGFNAAVYATRTELFADLSKAARSMAWVVRDDTPSNNGIYQKVGAPGSGYWTRIADLPYTFIQALDTGPGSPNAIQAETLIPVNESAIVVLTVGSTTTSSPVTVSFNGEPALTIKTISGTDVVAGGITAGMQILGTVSGSAFRLYSDQASAAIQNAAQTALMEIRELYIGSFASDAAASSAAGAPLNGRLYWNTTVEYLKVWDGAGWVSATVQSAAITDFHDIGDGATVAYSLTSGAQAGNTIVSVGGLVQGSGFTLVNGALLFSEAPPVDVSIDAKTIEAKPLGYTSAGLISVTDAGGFYNAENLEGVLAEIASSLSGDRAVPKDYGTTGAGNDTIAVQAALNSGRPVILIDREYVCDGLTIPASVREIIGPGTLKCVDDTTVLLTGTNLNDLLISTALYGSSTLGTTASSGNDGIRLVDCQNVVIRDCRIERFRFRPIIVEGGKNIRIDANCLPNNGVGPRAIGVTDLFLTGNLIDGTCWALSEFTTGIGLESTDGWGGRPGCDTVLIDGNIIRNIQNAQAILVHAGKNVRVTANSIRDAVIGISFNPYNTTDFISRPVIANNIIENFDGAWTSGSSGNSAIVGQAGPASGGGMTPNIDSPVITGNVITNGNRSKGGAGEGGIQISYANDAIVSGNVIQASKANGIVLNNCPRANIGPNNINVVFSGGGQQTGIYATSSTGLVHDNFIASVGTGVNVTGMTDSGNVTIA